MGFDKMAARCLIVSSVAAAVEAYLLEISMCETTAPREVCSAVGSGVSGGAVGGGRDGARLRSLGGEERATSGSGGVRGVRRSHVSVRTWGHAGLR